MTASATLRMIVFLLFDFVQKVNMLIAPDSDPPLRQVSYPHRRSRQRVHVFLKEDIRDAWQCVVKLDLLRLLVDITTRQKQVTK